MSEFDIHQSLLFKGVDKEYIDRFLESCDVIELAKDEYLFHQNEIGDSMYLVESGELQVEFERGSRETNPHLATLKVGSVIGELCVFGQQKRSASIHALVNSRLLIVEGEEFRIRIYSKELDALLISYNIAKLLSERLINTDSLLSISNNLKK